MSNTYIAGNKGRMKKAGLLNFLICLGLTGFSQTTFVPDDNFEQALIDLGLDMGPLDNLVETASIDTVTVLWVGSKGIDDLTGISDFINLRVLSCSINNISSLDVSSNTLLESLNCNNNNLSSLDLSSNILLKVLNCSDNNIVTLDLSENPSLLELEARRGVLETVNLLENTLIETINLDRNNIESIDITNNGELKTFICPSNALTELDVSNNLMLEKLNVSLNALDEIDVILNGNLQKLQCVGNTIDALNLSENINLKSLNCAANFLVELDLSTNVLLEGLGCGANELTELDLSNNTYLRQVNCGENPIELLDFTYNDSLRSISYQKTDVTIMDVSHLTYLEELLASDMPNLAEVNVANGNNGIIMLFYAVRAPNLMCITMDEDYIAYAAEHTWIWNKDDSAIFSADCGSLSVQEESLNEISLYPTVFNDFITVESTILSDFSVVNVAGQQLQAGSIIYGENRIDLSHLNSGVYVMELQTEYFYKTYKIMKP